MSAFIPDQLDQLSKKDLLEVAKIMQETNVSLNAQLVRANETIANLSNAYKVEFDKREALTNEK